MGDRTGIRCSIYRGGTSRGVYFRENDLPYPQEIRSRILLSVLGSPDATQVDGLGGGITSNSKAMIVGPSQVPGCDIQMLFAQIGVQAPFVDWDGTCGNLTTAIAPFAIDQGMVPAVEPITEVSIYSINTKKRVRARVPVKNGRAVSNGDFTIPGVRGSGARIELEFIEPAGTLNGQLLPTGRACEQIDLEDGRTFNVSIVDAGHLVVFCHAPELGLTGTELPSDIEKLPNILPTLELIRCAAAERLGIVKDRREASAKSPGIPKIGFVAAPATYSMPSGKQLQADSMDIVGRLVSMRTLHKSFMGAGAVSAGAAAMVKGTIIHSISHRNTNGSGTLRIGHPQGVMDVSVKTSQQNGSLTIESATIARTARCIMEGTVYVPNSCFTL